MVFETARLRLRVFEESDFEDLHLLYSDCEVMRFIPGTPSREKTEAHIRAFAEQFAKTRFTLWAVEQKSDGRFIGRAGLWPLDGGEEIELGYVFARPFWGKGFATEASAGCLEYGFNNLSLDRIAAIADPRNAASLHVLEKLGFRFIREDRYYEMDVLYHRLERQDWRGPQ